MIDPLKVLIITPTLDGKVVAAQAGGLISCASQHLFGNIAYLGGCSDVSLARNLLSNKFQKLAAYEWSVWLDADIAFSSDDFRILMDYPEPSETMNDTVFKRRESNPDNVTVNENGEALIVCAEYSRKTEELAPARFGMGFCRIHRSVFDTLENMVDGDRQPRVGKFRHQGTVYTHFFCNGPGFDGHWMGEDTGFFHLCRLAGIVPRIEQRTRLLHIGEKAYPYIGPSI